MFYCDPCASLKGWPKGLFKSVGRCEVCECTGVCSEVHHSQLPPAPVESCKVCDGGPNGHTFSCPTLPHNASEVVDLYD